MSRHHPHSTIESRTESHTHLQVVDNDTTPIPRVIDSVMYGSITWEQLEALNQNHFRQLIRLMQCCLQFYIHHVGLAARDQVRY